MASAKGSRESVVLLQGFRGLPPEICSLIALYLEQPWSFLMTCRFTWEVIAKDPVLRAQWLFLHARPTDRRAFFHCFPHPSKELDILYLGVRKRIITPPVFQALTVLGMDLNSEHSPVHKLCGFDLRHLANRIADWGDFDTIQELMSRGIWRVCTPIVAVKFWRKGRRTEALKFLHAWFPLGLPKSKCQSIAEFFDDRRVILPHTDDLVQWFFVDIVRSDNVELFRSVAIEAFGIEKKQRHLLVSFAIREGALNILQWLLNHEYIKPVSTLEENPDMDEDDIEVIKDPNDRKCIIDGLIRYGLHPCIPKSTLTHPRYRPTPAPTSPSQPYTATLPTLIEFLVNTLHFDIHDEDEYLLRLATFLARKHLVRHLIQQFECNPTARPTRFSTNLLAGVVPRGVEGRVIGLSAMGIVKLRTTQGSGGNNGDQGDDPRVGVTGPLVSEQHWKITKDMKKIRRFMQVAMIKRWLSLSSTKPAGLVKNSKKTVADSTAKTTMQVMSLASSTT
ncbi:hypothetical protein HK102_007022 [Quaeritorhiza haematococci]|nr:hypothetical protein HK102_007022 [Quaeritorhiza haematococci]